MYYWVFITLSTQQAVVSPGWIPQRSIRLGEITACWVHAWYTLRALSVQRGSLLLIKVAVNLSRD